MAAGYIHSAPDEQLLTQRLRARIAAHIPEAQGELTGQVEAAVLGQRADNS